MIKFRQRNFTLEEGHYTGPKDQDKVPGALEIIGKSALGGALAGSAVGAILKDSTALEGAVSGGKWGALAGVVFKLFLNYLHNPMTRIKFQDVDRMIRRDFGIYRAAGITVGDSLDKRASVDERFAFNDRNVTNYKLVFTVQDDQVTMYTFKLTDKELELVNKTLDYYCKKYTGMEYSSTIINRKINSYSATIVFTNYQVISNFIMELSKGLNTKINLLDNKALVSNRINTAAEVEEADEKSFSERLALPQGQSMVPALRTEEFTKTLTKPTSLLNIPILRRIGTASSFLLITALSEVGKKLAGKELVKLGFNMPRENFSNDYLKDTLKKLHYVPGLHYTEGRKDVNANISMISGRFVITVAKGPDSEKIDKEVWNHYKQLMNRADTGKGKVIVYSYLINSRKEFEGLLNKLFKTDIMFNVFEK